MPLALRVSLRLAALALVAVALGAAATPMESDALHPGKVELRSIGPLALGPDGVLFVADSVGAAVYAIDVGVKGGTPPGELPAIDDLDEKIASLLGVGVRDVAIEDLAYDKASGTTFLSITRGRGEKAMPVLLRIDAGGKISEVDLTNVRHARLALDDAPAAQPDSRRDPRTLTVTDMELVDGELFLAGLSNEEFASTLRRVHYPFNGEVAATGLEIYHGAHGRYETQAPIFTFLPYRFGDRQAILASYLCTPLVTFPLDQLHSQAKLRGKTIAELGFGNTPIDMIAYEYGGERYVLMTNNRRGTMKIKATDIEAAEKRDGITSEAAPRTGVDYESPPIGNVVQVADADADNILVLGRTMDNGALYLRPRPKRWL